MSWQYGSGGQSGGGSQGSGGGSSGGGSGGGGGGSSGSGASQGEGGTSSEGGGSGQGAFWYVGESRKPGGAWLAIDSATDNPGYIALQNKYRDSDNTFDYHIIYAGSQTGQVWYLEHGFANSWQGHEETHTCPTGQHWDAAKEACVHDVMTCPEGYTWDPTSFNPNGAPGNTEGYCVDSSGHPNCPPGKHWDVGTNSCIMDADKTGGTNDQLSLENLDAIVAILLVCIVLGVVAYAVVS